MYRVFCTLPPVGAYRAASSNSSSFSCSTGLSLNWRMLLPEFHEVQQLRRRDIKGRRIIGQDLLLRLACKPYGIHRTHSHTVSAPNADTILHPGLSILHIKQIPQAVPDTGTTADAFVLLNNQFHFLFPPLVGVYHSLIRLVKRRQKAGRMILPRLEAVFT